MQTKRLQVILFTITLLLLIPFIAMQFTDEVNWSPFDFVVAGALLLTIGLLCELVLRKVKKIQHRIVLCLAILLVFLLIWVELAVGIFDTPLSGN